VLHLIKWLLYYIDLQSFLSASGQTQNAIAKYFLVILSDHQ